MTCFLEGKVCENKTIHLISRSFPLPNFLLENMRMELDVSSRRNFGVSHSLWLWVSLSGKPCHWAYQLFTTMWCLYKLGKRDLVRSCRSAIEMLKRTGLSTDSCSTLLASGFHILINSYLLAHLVVASPLPDWYNINCLKDSGRWWWKCCESQGEWHPRHSPHPQLQLFSHSRQLGWSGTICLCSIHADWPQLLPSPPSPVQEDSLHDFSTNQGKANCSLDCLFGLFWRWVQHLLFFSHWGSPWSRQHLGDDTSGLLWHWSFLLAPISATLLVLWAWNQEMGWKIFDFWSCNCYWSCTVKVRGTQCCVSSSHSHCDEPNKPVLHVKGTNFASQHKLASFQEALMTTSH